MKESDLPPAGHLLEQLPHLRVAQILRQVCLVASQLRLGKLQRCLHRFGYERITWLLQRDGLRINRKRVYRIYKQEGLQVRKRCRKRERRLRKRLEPATYPCQRWSLDFVSDSISSGRRLRTLNVIDEFTRECPAIEVGFSLPGERVVRVLERLA